ncbi:MAG: velvet protein [Pleopsidium flavum]|nr:MAG: velvet protein [Pleopsidium flavum]KAI9878586.1 MAG: velvet protein [Pleopsidium flavum]
MASIIAAANETKSKMVRMTKEGKKLSYELNVIQQPERARACGSGAKSSADRRPVDPPPVVELRIYEGDAKSEVTFSYNANFFLFATLETARPIAQGRVSAPQTSIPVLTGMPVAGMAYLDRPNPAGYFIFPDLSVRHEGKYRLSFNLFEEVKEPKDADAEPAINHPDHSKDKDKKAGSMAPNSHVHWRLEVKSEPFTVFSAKKFPGLAESTVLSRVVAEQGCRVRIRRDVRMRRRDNKTGKDYEEYDEDGVYTRNDRYTTPDVYAQTPMPDRPRSVSHGSVDAPGSYTMEPQRRPSMQEMGYYGQAPFQQPQPPTPVAPPSAGNGYSSHLAFGSSSTAQYQTPQFPPSQTIVQAPQAYPQDSTSYHYQPSPHLRQVPTPQAYGYGSSQHYQQHQFAQPQVRQESMEYKPLADYRRASVSYPQSYPSQSISMYAQNDQAYARPASGEYTYYNVHPQPSAPRPATPSANNHSLPPLKTLQTSLDMKFEQPSSASVMPGPIIGASSSPSYECPQNKVLAYSAAPQSAPVESMRSSKRSYGSVFNSTHMDKPLHSGMRPSTLHQAQDNELDDDSYHGTYDFPDANIMSYRRADGSTYRKKCPSPPSE